MMRFKINQNAFHKSLNLIINGARSYAFYTFVILS